MSSQNGEFSFHEMEERKRRLDAAVSAMHDDVSPIPAPSHEATPVPGAVPQEFFSRSGGGDAESIQLQRLMRFLRRHWSVIILMGLLLPVFAFLYDEVLNQPLVPPQLRIGAERVFATSAEMERREAATSLEREVLEFDPLEGVSLNQVIEREAFAVLFEKHLQLLADNGALDAATEKAVARYIGAKEKERKLIARIVVGAMRDNVAAIHAEGGDRLLMPVLANAIPQVLNDYFREMRVDYLAEQLRQHRRLKQANDYKLQAANVELREIGDTLDREDPERLTTIAGADRLAEEHYRLAREREELSIRLEHYRQKAGYDDLLKRMKARSPEDIRKLLDESNPLFVQWREKNAELVQARTRYRDIHPEVQTLLTELETIEKELRRSGHVNAEGEPLPVPSVRERKTLADVQEMQDRLELNAMMIERTQAKLEKVQEQEKQREQTMRDAIEQNKIDPAMIDRRNQLREKVELLRAMSLELSRPIYRLERIENEVGKENDFEVIREAEHAVQVRPQPALDMFIALVIGLTLGCGVAFLLESMDAYIHTPSDVYYHLRLNYLGVIPYWGSREPVVIPSDSPDSHIAEVYAHLCNNIRYGRSANPEKRLLVVSATPGEGKSTVAANVAIRYAMEGNSVVLIDCDLRRPRGHKLIDIFEPEREMPAGPRTGLSDYLSGNAGMRDITYGTSVPGLSLIPAGTRARNAGKLIGLPELKSLLDWAEEQYDIVIVDSPAILPVVDGTILAPLMRGVLVVVAANEVEIGAVRMALYRLRHVGAPIAGAVLTKVKERSASYGYYGYRYRSDNYGADGGWRQDEDEA